MKITNGIKIAGNAVSAKAIAVIRRSTDLSIAEIRERAENGKYILEYESSSDKGIRSIMELYSNLKAVGCEAELYHRDIPRTAEFFMNLALSHRQTARELGIPEDELL